MPLLCVKQIDLKWEYVVPAATTLTTIAHTLYYSRKHTGLSRGLRSAMALRWKKKQIYFPPKKSFLKSSLLFAPLESKEALLF